MTFKGNITDTVRYLLNGYAELMSTHISRFHSLPPGEQFGAKAGSNSSTEIRADLTHGEEISAGVIAVITLTVLLGIAWTACVVYVLMDFFCKKQIKKRRKMSTAITDYAESLIQSPQVLPKVPTATGRLARTPLLMEGMI